MPTAPQKTEGEMPDGHQKPSEDAPPMAKYTEEDEAMFRDADRLTPDVARRLRGVSGEGEG